ncbi:DUF362 domain-containing protein [candidate division WOR-3 bacterium]|uniref:DUF362 domain-containing protein n=1 Tax=candidate division WOR-3 bacterium TaxID=2052148 RepID=A0A9D5K8L5_UNCW3|nr:DUF362 domain-containing protein [candidate division WOR-3 bacterium]MBD3364328.1 DUF362 domain-containing protein [candidate division WOR-3 bacterium]
MNKEKVILKRIKKYDIGEIRDFTRKAISILGIKPKPRAFLKPNMVMGPRYAEHAYTHPEFLRGVIRGLSSVGVRHKTIFEDCGLIVPLRFVYRRSGYNRLCRKERVRFFNLAEAVHDVKVTIPGGQVHGRLPLPSELLVDGLRVYLPKLKVHSQTDITCACKLMIGIIKRSIRLHRHHYDLGEKIVDSVAAYPPDLILVDAINVGINGVGCPDPVDVGVVIAARNPVAADAVSAWLLGFAPEKIEHLALASQRGLGPVDLSKIEIINPDNIKPARKGAFQERDVNQLNPHIRYFEGKTHGGRRCKGGCIGFVAESIHYVNHYNNWRKSEKVNIAAQALFGLLGQLPSQERPRKLGVVVGDYQGEIPSDYLSNLLFVGDCTRAGNLKPRAHLRGCPVYMARQAFAFAARSGYLNPYLDVMEGLPFIRAFLEEKLIKAYNIIKYNLRRFA